MIRYNILEYMKSHNISNNNLIKNGIMFQQTFYNLRNGKDISMKQLDKLCNYFDCEISDLIQFTKN